MYCFNPPSPFRARGTKSPAPPRRPARVSIRPRPFGRGELGGKGRKPHAKQVSIRPRPFGRGEPGALGQALGFNPPSPFRARGTRPARTMAASVECFNPPSPFRARGTGEPGQWQLRSSVSIRPRPFGRGERWRKASLPRDWQFQSALALSGEGNLPKQLEQVDGPQFQSALALSGEGNSVR